MEWTDHLDAAREDWSRLAAATGNIFATWEWASHWWAHYGRDGRLAVGSVRDTHGARCALLPLVTHRRGPLRLARFVGHGTADELGPICAAGDRPVAAGALRKALRHLGCHVLLAEHLPADAGWPAQLGGTVVRQEGFPVVRAPGGWEAYRATRSVNWRKKHGEKERRLVREHDVRFRLTCAPARLDADFDDVVSLHRKRWPDGSEFLDHVAFHRGFAGEALRQGWLRLWVLDLDGTPAACSYGFRFGEAESGFVFGRDPRFDRQSVGTMLHLHVMREAFAAGVREYRFLRGGEAYKYRFATHDPGIVTVAVPRGPLGRAALAAGMAADRLGPVRSHVLPALGPTPAAS
ncbi:MAG TPA: GNAT family N-acetyltransferase [Acidimicrobiales bacterium]